MVMFCIAKVICDIHTSCNLNSESILCGAQAMTDISEAKTKC